MDLKRTDYTVKANIRCAVCGRKFRFVADKKYLDLLTQTGFKDRPKTYWFKVGFSCPKCFSHNLVEYGTTNDSTELIKQIDLYGLNKK